MKVIFKDLKHGEIKLMPENLDDIWHLYNVVEEGDLVRTVTFRTDEQKDDKIRSKKAEKKRMKVGIRVSEVKFHEFSDRLRIHGSIEECSQDLGSFHTLNIDADKMDKVSKYDSPRGDPSDRFRIPYDHVHLVILSKFFSF